MSETVVPIVIEFARDFGHAVEFFHVKQGSVDLPRPFGDSIPTVLVVRNGRVVDMKEGGAGEADPKERDDVNRKKIRSLLARNGLIPGPFERYPTLVPTDVRRWLGGRRPESKLSSANMAGFNLSRMNLSGAVIVSSRLDIADLRGADLSGGYFMNTSFVGARLDGARLEGATWNQCVCPDGCYSEEVGGTCLGHLGGPMSSLH